MQSAKDRSPVGRPGLQEWQTSKVVEYRERDRLEPNMQVRALGNAGTLSTEVACTFYGVGVPDTERRGTPHYCLRASRTLN